MGGFELLLVSQLDEVEVGSCVFHLLLLRGFECDAPAHLIRIILQEGLLLLELKRTSLRELVKLVVRKAQFWELRVATAT